MSANTKANRIIENNIDKYNHIDICKYNALKETENNLRLSKCDDERSFWRDVLFHIIKSKTFNNE